MVKLPGTQFSGKHSSIMIYSDTVDKIALKPLAASFLYYYISEKKARVQNWIDMGRGGKFIFKKGFSFRFLHIELMTHISLLWGIIKGNMV